MIDNTVFQDKTAVYYTLGCKLNFAETSTLGQLIAEQGIRKARPGEKAYADYWVPFLKDFSFK